MIDMTTISAAISSVSSGIEIAKAVKDSSNSLEQAEIKLKMAELISVLADAKVAFAELQEELLERDKQIRRLKEKAELKDSMKFERPFYWKYDDDTKDGPYCSLCYDEREKLIRLQKSVNSPIFYCGHCKSSY